MQGPNRETSSLNMMAASLNVGSVGVMLAAAAFLALAAAMGLGTCGVMPVAVLAGGAATGLAGGDDGPRERSKTCLYNKT